MRCRPEHRSMLWSQPQPISWQELPGLCCQLVRNIERSRVRRAHKPRVEKTPSALKALTLFHLFHPTTTVEQFTHQGLHNNSKDERTVPTACPQPALKNGL